MTRKAKRKPSKTMAKKSPRPKSAPSMRSSAPSPVPALPLPLSDEPPAAATPSPSATGAAPISPVGGDPVAAIDAAIAGAERAGADDDVTQIPAADPLPGGEPFSFSSAEPPKRKRGRPRKDERRDTERMPDFSADFPGEHIPPAAPRGDGLSAPIQGEAAKTQKNLAKENAQMRDAIAGYQLRENVQVAKQVKASITGLCIVGGKIASRQYGDHCLVTQEEANEVGEHLGNALLPFLGSMAKYMPFVLAAGSIVGMVIPKLEIEAAIRAGDRQRIRDGQLLAPPPGAAH